MTSPSNHRAIRSEVERLASAAVDGRLDRAGLDRLEGLLRDNPQATTWYFDWVELHSLLEARHAEKLDPSGNASFERTARELLGVVCDPRDAGVLQLHRSESDPSNRLKRWTRRPLALAGALAACAAISAVVLTQLAGERELSAAARNGKQGYVGIVSQAVGVRWAEHETPLAVPTRLTAGQKFRLEAGSLELALTSGCVCGVKGPAEVEIVSPMHVRATSGALWARVGNEAKGFVIETPTANVVDLGTEFGVDYDRARLATDVVVFEGAVDLQVKSRDATSRDAAPRDAAKVEKRLFGGEALRVDHSGASHRIMAVRSDQFPISISSRPSGSRPAMFGDVRDNIRDANATMYYQIVREGLYDDCRAYVDRLHEWNGIDGTGIPRLLQGADYLMCFNSDKWMKDLEITVDVVRPAHLFVFFDDRLPVPKWLSSRFRKTDMRMGMDEGHPEESLAPQRTAYGAGSSIDTEYSVWQADFPRPEVVKFGALPKWDLEVSMYGVAAIPFTSESKKD